MSKREDLFFQHVGQTSPFPLKLEIEKARGIYFYTTDGKKYFDFTSGIAVSNLGHQNKSIVSAIKKQAEKHLHTMVYGEFIEAPQVKYADALTNLLPEKLNCLYYCTSGSEAVEAAIKLAKRKTGCTEIISCKGSYHGSTHGALSIMGSEKFKQAYRPLLPDTQQIEYNNLTDVNRITKQTAAVFVEVVQAASGVTVANKTWLKAIKARCKKVGAMLVFDEIQTGFGRTGSLFAFEQFDVEPDILLLAKAMGGGIPIGGLVTRKKWLDLFTKKPMLGHINTFGGNPIACAAALANLEQLTKQKELIAAATSKTELIKEQLSSHVAIEKITNLGLLMALHFKSKQEAYQFMAYALDAGVVLIGFLLNDQTVRLAPPLTITEKEIIRACKAMRIALDRLS